MNETRFAVDHVHLATDKPFEEVAKRIERQLGRFDPTALAALPHEAERAEDAKARIEALAGPSGFMLFGTTDHGALLRLAGQKRKAVQYVLGNPLFALRMTRHDVRAGLYAPLRVLLYEDDEGRTCVEYDRPSSLFGQFRDDRVSPTAALLDRKLEALVTAAMDGLRSGLSGRGNPESKAQAQKAVTVGRHRAYPLSALRLERLGMPT